MARSLLLIGTSGTGKTVYGGQLLGRLQLGLGAMSLRTEPDTIEPLFDAWQSLARGRTPPRTARGTYKELVLPVSAPGLGPVDLVWPDYSGEQISDVVVRRHIPDAWRERVVGADGLLVFVRPKLVKQPIDIITRPLPEIRSAHREAEEPPPAEVVEGASTAWASQADLVELLQILLYLRSESGVRRIANLPLSLAISCWDELPGSLGASSPREVLRTMMPLLDEYVHATWEDGSASVIGVSAQGRSLLPHGVDEAFADEGPENQGFVVQPAGQRTPDLTWPVVDLLARAK